MPNHIQNRLKVIGSNKEIGEVLEFISSKNEDNENVQIDFNKIKPMPDDLTVNPHSNIETAVEVSLKIPLHENELIAGLESMNRQKYKSPLEFSDEEFEVYVKCLYNVRKYGFMSWYEWSIANWGTKWNAYDQNDLRNTEDTIFFQTAWSAPVDLIKLLSSKFPNVKLQLDYADEDRGSNTGKLTLQNGELINSFQPESQSKEGYDIYFELHPGRANDYTLIGDKYEYIE